MEVFEIVIAMLLGGAALAALARWFGAPYPALVALAGAALALIPGVPTLVLDPELALALSATPRSSASRRSWTGRNSTGRSSSGRSSEQNLRQGARSRRMSGRRNL